MDISQQFWEDTSNMQPVKYESCNSNDEHPRLKDEPNLYRYCDGNLNFATVACSEDDSEYGSYHKKTKVSRQDPMSHRIIEKRRRDRMNNCLADLSRLIPADYLKKGRGRIEKTEIIEMAIKHMKYLQQTHITERSPLNTEHYRLGFQECMSETMRFLVEVEGFFAHETLCVKLINHLQGHCEAVLTSDRLHTGNSTTSSNQNAVSHSHADISPVISPNGQIHNDPTYDASSQLRDMLSSNSMKDSSNTNRISNHNQISNNTRERMNGSMTSDSRNVSPGNIEKQMSPGDLYTTRNIRDKDIYDYQRHDSEHISRQESDMNSFYSTDAKMMNYDRTRQSSEGDGNIFDKNRECTNGASLYKFKNNIMQRINQESISESISNHSLAKSLKRKKMMDDTDHRTLLTDNNFNYSENHSNSPTDVSQTSPPSSDGYTRISSESDNQNRISPTGSSVSDNKHAGRQSPKRFSNFPKHLNQISQNSHENIKHANSAQYERYSPNNIKHNVKNAISQHFHNKSSEKSNFGVPIFVLHAKGSFYIPLTIDYHSLVPYLQNYNILDVSSNVHNIILHPVTINVNFQPNSIGNICSVVNKQMKYKTEVQNGWH